MAKASQGKGRGGFQTLRPLAAFRPRRIPNLASLIAVPYDANLTVVHTVLPTSIRGWNVGPWLRIIAQYSCHVVSGDYWGI